MRIIIVATLLMLILNLVSASSGAINDKDNNDFGLSIGINEYQVKEKTLNNIRHRGLFPTLAFTFEKSKDISQKKLAFNLVVNLLKSRYDPERASIVINPSISYRYARKVKSLKPNLDLFLGGMTRFNSISVFYENWDDSHIYWLTTYDLEIDCILNYQKTDKSLFRFELNTPIAALVSRPPERFLYKVIDTKFSWLLSEYHDNLRLTSFHEHFALNMELEYIFRYTKKFKQRIYWQFCYINNNMSYSKNIHVLTHTFGITFLF